MTLFLVTFFSLYALTHVYAFLRAKAALAFSMTTSILVILFLLLMIAAPFIVRFAERAGLESPARVMAYIGYTWLGVLFLFFSFSLALDIYRFMVYAGGLMLKKDIASITVSARYAFFLPLFFSLLTSVYGYFEAKDIRTERVVIRTPKIPPELGSLKIVQISDVHLGLIIREERLKRILEEIKKAEPDMLVSTGDLVDGQVCRLNGLSDLLKEIRPKFGKFAITGNHEFYAGFDQARCFTENSGFTLLRGEALTVENVITVAGVDDPAAKIVGLAKSITENDLLSRLPRDKFILFLKHRPLFDRDSIGLYDLQLSGHVHKGQIFPFSILTKLYYPAHAGFISISENSSVYVSRGAGTWGPPIRFLSPPEIAVIELVHGE